MKKQWYVSSWTIKGIAFDGLVCVRRWHRLGAPNEHILEGVFAGRVWHLSAQVAQSKQDNQHAHGAYTSEATLAHEDTQRKHGAHGADTTHAHGEDAAQNAGGRLFYTVYTPNAQGTPLAEYSFRPLDCTSVHAMQDGADPDAQLLAQYLNLSVPVQSLHQRWIASDPHFQCNLPVQFPFSISLFLISRYNDRC